MKDPKIPLSIFCCGCGKRRVAPEKLTTMTMTMVLMFPKQRLRKFEEEVSWSVLCSLKVYQPPKHQDWRAEPPTWVGCLSGERPEQQIPAG